jgi:hypothetical protein
VPRFRYDQIMHLGWKVLLPGALAYVVLMAASILVLDTMGVPFGFVYGLILTAINAAATILFLVVIDRDRVIAGSARSDIDMATTTRRGPLPRGVTVEPAEYAGSSAEREGQGSEWP